VLHIPPTRSRWRFFYRRDPIWLTRGAPGCSGEGTDHPHASLGIADAAAAAANASDAGSEGDCWDVGLPTFEEPWTPPGRPPLLPPLADRTPERDRVELAIGRKVIE
jgi:hypothetical protein